MSPASTHPASTPPRALRLRKGQCCGVQARAGTRFIATQGTVCLNTVARSLADMPWRTEVLLHTGQPHEVANAGWVQLHTHDDMAELWCLEPTRGGAAWLLIASLAGLARSVLNRTRRTPA